MDRSFYNMKFAPVLILQLSLAVSLAAQQNRTRPPAGTQAAASQAAQESEEIAALKEKFSEVLDAVNASWFGSPYQQIRAVDLNGTMAIYLSGTVIDDKIQQLTQGALKGLGTKTGQAICSLSGTYFANGDHLYNVNGDFGSLRFQRLGERGFWYIRDQNVYTTAITLAPPDGPVSFMGWFASVVSDIKEVYIKGTTFSVSKGSDTTVGGRAAQTIVFNSPTSPYDPSKREQPASDTFGFWKKGRMEVAYDPATKQPLKMSYANVAQGVEAGLEFNYNAEGRIRQVVISNRSKQWEGPGFVRASYGGDGMISAIAGELTGRTHKITFNLSTVWNKEKATSSIQSVVPPVATKLGREDMELRFAMMFAGNIGDLQKMGFNFMMPKVSAAQAAPMPIPPTSAADPK
jgi:hypothetical protein